tara:strand:- start:5243 stop:5665 length:423 start_codon:yes stop_codon:yes gene_type:complete
MSEITLYDYLAANVPTECMDILASHGYDDANSVDEIAEDLKQFVREHRTEALAELAEVHPDLELLKDMVGISTPYEGNSDTEYLNATGTLDRISNIENTLMTGSSSAVTPTNEIGLSKSDFILGIGVVIVTSLLLHKNKV